MNTDFEFSHFGNDKQMGECITGTQAKEADLYAINVLQIPSLDLIERASVGVADIVLKSCPGERILIISGVGNNGADGVCIARLLRRAMKEPTLLICGDLRKATWEFLYQLSVFRKEGGVPEYVPDMKTQPENVPGSEGTSMNILKLPECDVLVDAIFGIGLKRPVEGIYKDLISAAQSLRACRIAVDVPSGINADTGEKMGVCIHADMTVTFGRNKSGLTKEEGLEAAGEILVYDIGIPDEVYSKVTQQDPEAPVPAPGM